MNAPRVSEQCCAGRNETSEDLEPAVVHVDGSGRLQAVLESSNAIYVQRIRVFESETGVPIVFNASFNLDETFVNTPAEAHDCFLLTKMDRLVMGKIAIVRSA